MDRTRPGPRLTIVPISRGVARAFVASHHRHADPPISHKFSVGLVDERGELRAVVIAGRPVGRNADDGFTIEVTRLATLDDRNACSRLYGAVCRAAFAMGYRRVITFTLASENGAALRASGFVADVEYTTRTDWSRSSRRRGEQAGLFYESRTSDEPRVRWVRTT